MKVSVVIRECYPIEFVKINEGERWRNFLRQSDTNDLILESIESQLLVDVIDGKIKVAFIYIRQK